METKRCTHCGEVKPVGIHGAFSPNGVNNFRSRCRPCEASLRAQQRRDPCQRRKDTETQARYRARHRDEINRRRRSEYQECEGIREYRKSQTRAWYQENRERVRSQKHAYHASNPQIRGLHSAVQRSLMSEEELLEGASREEVFSETSFTYRLCRLISLKTGIAHHVDHIIPIAKGGVHRLWNLRILPASENLSKSDKFDAEWFNLTDSDIERLDEETLSFNPSQSKNQ